MGEGLSVVLVCVSIHSPHKQFEVSIQEPPYTWNVGRLVCVKKK